jgi:hypothetical protein
MRSGAATGADSSSSPTDMDCAPPYNMKQMEIPHSKRREWRCEVFKVHSRPLNLVSRYGVKPGLTSRQLLGLRSGQHTDLVALRHARSTRFASAGPRSSLDTFCASFRGM